MTCAIGMMTSHGLRNVSRNSPMRSTPTRQRSTGWTIFVVSRRQLRLFAQSRRTYVTR